MKSTLKENAVVKLSAKIKANGQNLNLDKIKGGNTETIGSVGIVMDDNI